MDSSTVMRSLQYSIGTVSHVRPFLERPGLVNTSSKLYIQSLSVGGILTSPTKRKGMLVSCVKTPEATKITNSSGSLEKSTSQKATFPSGLEDLVLEVCDETEVAELKLKIGGFEMHMKRNVGATTTPVSASPTIAPPAPSRPMIEPTPQITPPSPPKPSSVSKSPFQAALELKSRKLLALEASGATGYDFVDSPKVGTFRRGRSMKGKKFPPVCKEGDVIKERQVIGFVYHFNTQIPVRSDKAGTILKFVVDDEEPIGYGDHILAILPSFQGIK